MSYNLIKSDYPQKERKTVETFQIRREKKLVALLIPLLMFASLNALSVNMVHLVSAVPLSPYIAVVPESTVNETITPGMNYTVSIYTNYTGEDIWAWQFTLSYNPDVLQIGQFDLGTNDTWINSPRVKTFYTTQAPIVTDSEKVYVDDVPQTRNVNYTIDTAAGRITFMVPPRLNAVVKATYTWFGVVNGDIITRFVDPTASFIPGAFDNTLGKLSLTGAYFYYVTPPPYTTFGPGTLATIIFRVVGTGAFNITLGDRTQLRGWDPVKNDYAIIDATEPPGKTEPPYGSDHIGHGYFDNRPEHNVAVTRLVAPATAILGDIVAINVTVANGGMSAENVNVTVNANTTILIGKQTNINLAIGGKTTLTFPWDTSAVVEGNYKINATVLAPVDERPEDNWKTTQIEIKAVHDVAIVSLEVPSEVIVRDIVSINVTVANQGSFEENLNLTVTYEREKPLLLPKVINTTIFMLAKLPTRETVSVKWNTTGLNPGTYKINATASIIAQDEDPGDNSKTQPILLRLGHDVEVTEFSATSAVFVGQLVAISVTVKNVGEFNETNIEVKVTWDTNVIESPQIVSLNVGDSEKLSFTWNTTGVAPAKYDVTAEAILAGDVNPSTNQMPAVVEVKLPAGYIAGIVKDASTGNPIQGVNVTASSYFSITDANGRYNIANVLAGTYTVTASKNGYQTASKTGVSVVAGQTTSLNFTLTPIPTKGHIAGIVKDASGNPIEGVNVTANGYFDITDANGRYNITNVPAETYTVTASKDGYESSSKTVTVIAGQTTTADFELKSTPQSNIFLYAAAVVVVIIVIVGIALYLRKGKKAT